MKSKLFAAATDQKDGTFSLTLHNTEEEALKDLGVTREELDEGSFYDDGAVIEIDVEFNSKGKLKKPVHINIG